jgi:general secretion pathway protein N
MMRSVVVLLIGLMLTGAADAQDATSPPVADRSGDAVPDKGRVATSAADLKQGQASGNPLWAIPLRQLTETRLRPLFSPSRRPPPVIAKVERKEPPPPPPAPPAEPEKPQLLLVGTITGSAAAIAIFRDKTGKEAS